MQSNISGVQISFYWRSYMHVCECVCVNIKNISIHRQNDVMNKYTTAMNEQKQMDIIIQTFLFQNWTKLLMHHASLIVIATNFIILC